MGRSARGMIAAFDALVMIGIAFTETGAHLDLAGAHGVVWGAAAAAVVCAGVVLLSGPAALAWGAIGFIAFAALLSAGAPDWVIAALALALMPLVPRPRGSLALGLAIAGAVALAVPLGLRMLV